MSDSLKNKRIAILATDGVEKVALLGPKKALEQAGATTQVISPKTGKIRGWNHTDWGQEIPVDLPLTSAHPNNFDACPPGRCDEPRFPPPGPRGSEVCKVIFRSS
jgi:protease I